MGKTYGISIHSLQIMRISSILIFLQLFAVYLFAAHDTNAQLISIAADRASVREVFSQIEKQAKFTFSYQESTIKETPAITLYIKNKQLTEVLFELSRKTDLNFKQIGKVIAVTKIKKDGPQKENGLHLKPIKAVQDYEMISTQDTIRGKVINENGEPLIGASVAVKGTKTVAITGNDGGFVLPNTEKNATLIITYVGYESREVSANNTANVILNKKTSYLDEVQVIPYGTTTRRLNTGSVSSITSEEIENQPVSNPLATLAGRVPGIIVSENSGMPGSGFSIQIRGRNSLAQGSEPLYLIDGIPFSPGNINMNVITNSPSPFSISGQSPFYAINPTDIESIEILKDADALAIYGSRGANGVVMITTKKATVGKTSISANISSGVSHVVRMMDLMNTEQYLEMRREAFNNDGYDPDIFSAPDLLLWDTNRYTDYQKELIGGTARRTNAQLSVSGGTANTQVLFSGGYLKETNVFPGDLPNQRGNASINARHASSDQRFQLNLSTAYSYSENRSPATDLTYLTYLAPNTPSFYDDARNLQWELNGATFENPYTFLHRKFVAQTENFNSSLVASYQLFESLTIRTSMGYNTVIGNQIGVNPASAENPIYSPVNNTVFADNRFSGWTIEPQAEYTDNLWLGKLSILVGATLQSNTHDASSITASGFSNESLMESLGAASELTFPYSTNTQYRYGAAFGRINYNIADKYLINITGRRDGSSRFGPGKQFATFGAVGAAWIFSEEQWVKQAIPVLSYGKLRGSYGSTGNDQIGDYRYLDTWAPYERNYSNMATIYPLWLYNPSYGWEVNKKLEGALELSFFEERTLLSTAFFRNRSGNQLVNYSLPTQTGFMSINRNMPALIQNSGWELMLNTVNIRNSLLNWSSSFNITFAKNKLLEFPDLETSPYAYQYIIGQPLNLIYGFRSMGVDPETGVYQFLDVDGSETFNAADLTVNGNLDPKYYGGFRNTISIKGFEADVFFEFRKQIGLGHLGATYLQRQIPGTMYNQPSYMLDRWQQEGDLTEIEKFTTFDWNTGNTTSSDVLYEDASYLRLKNICIAYNFPKTITQKIKADNFRIYLQGQNLLTITNYSGIDPETRNPFWLPTLGTYTIGAQIIF